MDRKLSQKIKEQIASLRSQRRWRGLIGVLSVLVLCATVCALILPGVASVGEQATDLTSKVTKAEYKKMLTITGPWRIISF